MSIFATGQKKSVKIEDVNVVIKKLSLEKQLTVSSLYNQNKPDEAILALILNCVESWDAKDTLGNDVPMSPESIKSLSVDAANKLSDEILTFNNLNKDQVKN